MGGRKGQQARSVKPTGWAIMALRYTWFEPTGLSQTGVRQIGYGCSDVQAAPVVNQAEPPMLLAAPLPVQ